MCNHCVDRLILFRKRKKKELSVVCCLFESETSWLWFFFKSINQRKGKWNFIYLLKFLIKFLMAETSQNVPKFPLARRPVTQTFSNIRSRYWVGHLRKTNFRRRAPRWGSVEKRRALCSSDRALPVGAEICGGGWGLGWGCVCGGGRERSQHILAAYPSRKRRLKWSCACKKLKEVLCVGKVPRLLHVLANAGS